MTGLPRAMLVEIGAEGLPTVPGKSCGSCTQCCSVVPVEEIGLKSYHRCPHLFAPYMAQAGCSIHATKPRSCREWSCSWLTSDLPDELRPDRCGVVLDVIPELIRVGGKETPAAQLWVTKGHEDDWQRNPMLSLLHTIFDQDLAVLWRLPPEREGGPQMAQAFARGPDGQIHRSGVQPAVNNLRGFKNPGERFARAQQILERRAT